MRKTILAVSTLALAAGISVYAIACDQSSKNTTAKASGSTTAMAAKSCPAMKGSSTVLTGAGGSCSAHKSAATTAAKDHCAAKGSTAAAGGCAMKEAGADCANYVFSIADMKGECCETGIEKALAGVKNVQAVFVDSDEQKVYVCTGAKKLDNKAAVKKLNKAGFKQASYVGLDSEHCVHEMKANKAAATSKV